LIVIDTGPLVAFANQEDPLHARAVDALERAWGGEHGEAFSTDFVLDEGMTVLMIRVGRKSVSQEYARLFDGSTERPLNPMMSTPADVLQAAIEIHLRHFERRLSFTDCTLVAHAKRRNAKVLTFDRGFDGLVEVVHP